MNIKLIYKTNNNKFFGTKNTMTIKEAEKLSEELKKDKNVIEIYLKRFDGWFWHRYKTLYKK